jgi:hypothetical protein
MEFSEFKLKVFKKYFDIEKEEEAIPVLFLCLPNNRTKLCRLPEPFLEDKDKMEAHIEEIIEFADAKYVSFAANALVHKVDNNTEDVLESTECVSMMFQDFIADHVYTVSFEKVSEHQYKFHSEFSSNDPGTSMDGRFVKSNK